MKSLNLSVFNSQYSKIVHHKQYCKGAKLLFPLRIASSPRFFFVSKLSQQRFTSSSCWWVLLSLAYSLTHFTEQKVILVSYEWSAFWGQMFSQVEKLHSPHANVARHYLSHFHLFVFMRWESSPNYYYFSSGYFIIMCSERGKICCPTLYLAYEFSGLCQVKPCLDQSEWVQ